MNIALMNFYKINSLKIFFIFLSIIVISCLIANNGYAKKNRILFKVDSEIITSMDLLEEAKYLIAINDELKKAQKEIIFEIAKKSLIRNKIKEIELNKRLESVEVQDNFLNQILLNYFQRLNINSEIDLKKFFENQNIDRSYVENRLKIDVLWNEYIYSKYSKNIKIDENRIKTELQNKKIQNEFLLSEILFEVEKNENFEKKLSKIKYVIENKGFSEAALSFSLSNSSDNGGKLGWVKETSLNKKIRNKIIKLEKGNYTDPIVIPGGFLILKIINKRTSEIEIDLNEEIKQITRKQTNEQLNQFSTIYFNKIKKDITINEF